MKRRSGLSVVLSCLLAVVPALASAQVAAGSSRSPSPFAAGGELSGSIAPGDADSFFNYTDYDQDGLRVARARLFGEWRLHPSLQAVGELRLESGRDVDVAAWFLRWRPRADWAFDVQAGRIPPVFGAFARRAYGRDNPVIGLPLAYQYLTSLRSDAAPIDLDDVLRMRGRGWQPSFPIGSRAAGPGLPLVSATEWSTGIEVRWRRERVEVAGAVTQGAPSTPRSLEPEAGPQWSGRIGFDLPGGAMVGVSGARGRWLDRDVAERLPAAPGDTSQVAVGVDLEYGSGPWLFRGEWIRTVHELPLAAPRSMVVDLTSQAGFAELRWRPHPRWQVAGRAEYLRFGSVQGGNFPDGPWDAPVERLEGVINYRVTRRLDVRVGWQHNWRAGGRIRSRGFPMAAVLFWF